MTLPGVRVPEFSLLCPTPPSLFRRARPLQSERALPRRPSSSLPGRFRLPDPKKKPRLDVLGGVRPD